MALQVIGIVLKVISMAPMLASMMPDKTDRETNIRIGVGTSINKDDTTGKSCGLLHSFYGRADS